MGYAQTKVEPAVSTLARSVIIASADADVRQRLREVLAAMRWDVREAAGGAEAISHLDSARAEALLVDTWLPDLEVSEFASQVRTNHPEMDLVCIDGSFDESGTRSPRRNELLHALRQIESQHPTGPSPQPPQPSSPSPTLSIPEPRSSTVTNIKTLPDVIGEGPAMQELAHMVRLVAPRSTTVLIEGATGSGKELVAKAIHRLSARSSKPFVVLNCAAIPESLLEAELFGHTRGAFTGAVQSRTGRVEAANGGTLFLDEIGEMPLALQAKMLRFLESGEIQRVGGNEMMQVDVRVVAATHQPLKLRTQERAFRLDLYHRLAVFPIAVPALADRMEDIPPLAAFFLEKLGEEMPVKRLSPAAMRRLLNHDWPGNVRELAHVLERATILAEDRSEIAESEIRP